MAKDKILRQFNVVCNGAEARLFSIEKTLDIISNKCNTLDKYYLIRISDIDKNIVLHQANNAKREKHHREYCERMNLPGKFLFERTNEDLRKELIEADQIGLLNDEHVDIVPYNGKSLYNEYRSKLNFNCFAYGFCLPDIFIPFCKSTLKDTLFLCNQYVNNNDLVRKVYGVKTFLELPEAAYFYLDDYYDDIKKLASTHKVILGGVGFSTKVIAKRLYKDGIKTKFLDIGSSADPLANRFDRKWSKRLIRNNLTLSYSHVLGEYKNNF